MYQKVVMFSRHNLHPFLNKLDHIWIDPSPNRTPHQGSGKPGLPYQSLLFMRMNRGGGTHTTPPQLVATTSFGAYNVRGHNLLQALPYSTQTWKSPIKKSDHIIKAYLVYLTLVMIPFKANLT